VTEREQPHAPPAGARAASPAERPASVARLLDELDALERAYSVGHHGKWSASRRAVLVDACLRVLFEAAEAPSGTTLVALGGYGRRRLSPASDVDLLILHDGSSPEEIGAFAERVLYPLWDAGLTVGHGVRTPDECVALASERLDARTAMLDGRALAGDLPAWDETRRRVVELVRSEPRAFADALLADADTRRERFGAASSLLEPDVKEGAGGLRDVQLLAWLQIALGTPLEELGLLRVAERQAVGEADEFLERVRGVLHLESRRRTDRISLDQQSRVARHLGFEEEPDLPAVDALMRFVFEHARQVEHVVRSVFDRYLRHPSEEPEFQPTPGGVLRAFVRLARDGGSPRASFLDRVADAPFAGEVQWTDDVRDAFLELLSTGSPGVSALEMLDRIGLLARYIPAWSAVRCRPQRDPYHRFSVDIHLLHALEAMCRLLDRRDEHEPMTAEAVRAVSDHDALRLGALLHDIGKTGLGRHVAEGARIAEATLSRMGVAEGTRSLAGFMVAEHLLLSDTSTRRDLEDEDLVHDVAAQVGHPERLAALYLLTVADAEATGPMASTAWRGTLARELVAKVQHVLERGDVGPDTSQRLAERVRMIREGLGADNDADVERFLERMPHTYVLTVPVERIVRQLPLIATPLAAREVRTMAETGERPGTYSLTVAAADSAGLLSLIAGALTLAGLSILTAQVFTTEDGVAVDVFEVEGAFEAEVGEDRWREFRGILRRAIEGRLSLAYSVGEKRKHYPPPPADVPVRVSADNDASDFFTVIEVGAPDRIGVLFDITRTLAELQLDVHLAKVATYGPRVVDAFYVRDELGRKVDDAERIAELEGTLRARLSAS